MSEGSRDEPGKEMEGEKSSKLLRDEEFLVDNESNIEQLNVSLIYNILA